MEVQNILIFLSASFVLSFAGGDNRCGVYFQQSLEASRKTETIYEANRKTFENNVDDIARNPQAKWEKIHQIQDNLRTANETYAVIKKQAIAQLATIIDKTPEEIFKVLEFDQDSEQFPFRCIYNDAQFINNNAKVEYIKIRDYSNRIIAELN